ncbi:hypothetical protein GCM10027190_00160 [Spirosoma areae]
MRPDTMRNLKDHTSYNTNPFAGEKKAYARSVFQPDDYTLNLLISLSPRALRVLLVIAARVDASTGLSYCPTRELRTLFSHHSANISRAKTELLRARLVAYGKANHTFYVNPAAFRPIHLTLE